MHTPSQSNIHAVALRSILMVVGIFFSISVFGQFEEIDKEAREIPIRGLTVDNLARTIESKAKTDLEKARMLFTFIAHNIEYDLSAFKKGNYSYTDPNDVLKYRKAVCQGYSNLFQEVCRQLNIRSEVIEGLSKGYGFTGKLQSRADHTWNTAFIGGEWILFDPTWGAGYIRNEKFVKWFEPKYFRTPPHEFVTNHLPSDPAFQLLPCPIKPIDFLKDSISIRSIALTCPTPNYAFHDTLTTDYEVSDSLRILRKARRKAQYAEFGLPNAAVEINTLASSLMSKFNTPAPPSQERLDEARNILYLLNEAQRYAKRSKSPDAQNINQVIEFNIKNLKEFIEATQKMLKAPPR